MKFEKVLENLEELLRKWGVTSSDWFLTAEYAWKLQGYNFNPRKGHLDIYVNRGKWPWKTEPEDISCFPPPKSKEFKQLAEFMKETKFSLHFLPVPIKLKYHSPEELRKNSIDYVLPNRRKIKIHKILEDFKERERTLLVEDLSTWKRETVERWLKYFSGIGKIAKKKNDKEMIKICDEALKKLKKVKRELRLVKEKLLFGISLIKGTPAFKGKVRGKVQVVLSIREISKFKKENILVTKMTTPEFILAVERAKAIVTDEGGIGCHAAVISREFRIPCIIGTRIATKVLKDGDLVKVDAEKGIVKILESVKSNKLCFL